MVYRPTARVLAVLELLQAYPRMSGGELARRLEVDVRTIRNYVQTLQDLGVPVEAERGRSGFYYLRPGYKLPPLIFNEDEALALTLSLLIGQKQGLATTEPAFQSMLAKVERVLPQATRERMQAVAQTVVFEQKVVAGANLSSEAVTLLSRAVQSTHSVQLSYRSSTGEITKRLFDPYGVVFHEGLWYTIGYCHLRAGQRVFRLDRVARVEVADNLTFSLPQNFEVLAEVQRSLASVPSKWQLEIWLETSVEEAHQQLQMSKNHFKKSGNGVLLEGEVNELDWITRHLAGLSVPFIIRKPVELREFLHRHALRLAAYAQQK